MTVTRRQLLIATGGLLTLAACGNDSSPISAPNSNNQDSAFPVKVEHKYGTTEITAPPKRVVTVGLSDHDPVLALGVKPVGVTNWYEDYPYGAWAWATQALGDAKPAVMPRNDDKLDFEKLAAMQPDLIIGQYCGMTKAEYETASKIAPTVAQSAKYPDYGTPWQDMTLTIGRALGKEDKAKQLIADVDAKFAAARTNYPQFTGRSAVVAEVLEDSFVVRGATDPRTRFLISLGFVSPEEIGKVTGDNVDAQISPEQITLLDRDLLVWNADYSPNLRQKLSENRLYQGLKVAGEGRDLFLDDRILSGALTWSTVLSLPYALDGLLPKIVAAVDGNPSTKA